MDNSRREKVNKKPEKISKDAVAIVIAVLLIAVYIFYECYVVTHVEVETITALNSTVYETIDATALIVRDEHTLENKSDVLTVTCVSDGEKINVNGNIAMVFSSSDSAKKYSQLEELNSQLDYYVGLQSKSAGIATDIDSIDKDILSDVNDYIRNTADYSAQALSNSAQELNDKLTRRKLIIGEDVDFLKIITSLQKQIDSINKDSCAPSNYITTSSSGIFSSYTDGCEDMFDYENIAEINADKLDNYISKIDTAEKSDSLGKLVTNYNWYFCCKVKADSVRSIEDGDTLEIMVKNSNEVYTCTVVSGATTPLGETESVLVLKCSEMNASVTSMRIEDIEIRYDEHTGIKVPTSAIHVDDNGNKGVYALVANQVVFRKANILYSSDNYVIFEYDANDNETIRLYDQIITKGKDLHDGKVYT